MAAGTDSHGASRFRQWLDAASGDHYWCGASELPAVAQLYAGCQCPPRADRSYPDVGRSVRTHTPASSSEYASSQAELSSSQSARSWSMP